MKIVIAGAGKVGFTMAMRLCREKHDITLIDTKREALEAASNAMDVLGICGSCAAPSVLREAEVGTADVFISATGNDEANLVACQFARKLGSRHTIARLRNQILLTSPYLVRIVKSQLQPQYFLRLVLAKSSVVSWA